MTSKKLFESKPRWIGAPKICIAENLPAFKDEKELGKFVETNSPGANISEKWKCDICGHWHFKTKRSKK